MRSNFQLIARLLACTALITMGLAAPTDEREWSSTAGTKITASALSVSKGNVSFKTSDDRTLNVPLDKLVEADRDFLTEHFDLPKPGDPVGSGTAPAEGLIHPVGQTVGPIKASDGSHYLVYLPKSLKRDRPAPLIFWTHSGGGSKKIMDLMIPGAELAGWIAACSIESCNNNGFESNHKNTVECLDHLFANLPIDQKRVYFTGSSGGAATAFYNAARLDHAGVLSSVGYLPDEEVPSGGDYFITNGAYDFNRYISTTAADRVGWDNSTLRYSEKGHGVPPDWMMVDATIWLNIRYLSRKGKKLEDERLDFERSVLDWARANKNQIAHRCYHALTMMKEKFELSDANAAAYERTLSELDTDTNRRYVEGIAAIERFAYGNYLEFGTSSQMEHTTPKLESAAKKLSEEYAGIPQLEEIALKLGARTDRLGKEK